jgi:hypothetical protein
VDNAPKRIFHEMCDATISMYKYDLKNRILEAAKSNQYYMEKKKVLHKGNFQQKIKYYELREFAIFIYKGRVYVPESQKLKIMVLK